MIDYSKYEIRQILSSNHGTLTENEYNQVVQNAENDPAYLMPGIQHVQYMTEFGKIDYAIMDLNYKQTYYDSLPTDIQSFEEFMAS